MAATAPSGGLAELAARLAEQLAADVELARTRDEHVRVTARAHEARRLADALSASGAEE